ncbi:hypothetical protein ABIE26_000835 [Pedobacter africanus]|uniref:Uncharacterized protein n=1 Tax=Pedobacter africanus TaxID=151894 RepID=A0ACC6KU58_9SPHI|nr:hypothetical protein [Pedobacter africanus]
MLYKYYLIFIATLATVLYFQEARAQQLKRFNINNKN